MPIKEFCLTHRRWDLVPPLLPLPLNFPANQQRLSQRVDVWFWGILLAFCSAFACVWQLRAGCSAATEQCTPSVPSSGAWPYSAMCSLLHMEPYCQATLGIRASSVTPARTMFENPSSSEADCLLPGMTLSCDGKRTLREYFQAAL